MNPSLSTVARAVSENERVFGSDHPNALRAVGELGGFLNKAGQAR